MSGTSGPALAKAGPPPTGKWILVVDDQPVMRDILEQFLRAGGHFVSTAAGSDEGLAKARSLPVDLVVLDLDMAASDGFRLAARLKDERGSLPVLFISARHKPHDLGKIGLKDAGGFLGVPFSLAEVRVTVARLLGDRT